MYIILKMPAPGQLGIIFDSGIEHIVIIDKELSLTRRGRSLAGYIKRMPYEITGLDRTLK